MPAKSGRKVFVAKQQKRGDQKKQFTCHFCKKPGHFRKDFRKFLATQQSQQEKKKSANTADAKKQALTMDSEGEALVTTHALTASSRRNWIVDLGTTCHMCNDKSLFSEFRTLETPQ